MSFSDRLSSRFARRPEMMRPSDDETPPPETLDRALILIAVVIVVGGFMTTLDTTIVNVAIPTLSDHFRASLTTIQWATTGYLLALTIVIPLSGYAVERFGAKRVWMISIGLFVVGSALAGLAWSAHSLIACRILQGLGGGMILPVGQAIAAQSAGPRRMGRMMSALGVPILLGPILGPVLGGLIVEFASWRWIFFVNIPIGVVGLVLAGKILGDGVETSSGRLDWRGLLLLSPGLALVVYGLSAAGSAGAFVNTRSLMGVLVGGTLVACFLAHARGRGRRALIDMDLVLRSRVFSASVLTCFLFSASIFGVMLLLPIYYEGVRGSDPLIAGLMLAPQGAGAAMTIAFTGRLTDRYGAGRVVPFGLLVALLGTAVYTQLGPRTPYPLLALALWVRGLGLGGVGMPAIAAGYAALEHRDIPRATTALNIAQRIGSALGTALLAVILERRIEHVLPTTSDGTPALASLGRLTPTTQQHLEGPLANAFSHALWFAFAITAAMLIPALFLPRRRFQHKIALRGDPELTGHTQSHRSSSRRGLAGGFRTGDVDDDLAVNVVAGHSQQAVFDHRLERDHPVDHVLDEVGRRKDLQCARQVGRTDVRLRGRDRDLADRQVHQVDRPWFVLHPDEQHPAPAAHGPKRRLEAGLGARRLDHDRRAVRARDRSVAGDDRPGRADLSRRLETILVDVDRHDLACPDRSRSGDDERADPTGADDDDAVAALDPRSRHRVERDRERLPQDRRPVAARLANRNACRSGHDHLLGQASVGVEPDRVVVGAEVRAAGEAPVTVAARHPGAGDDAVTDLKPLDTVSHGRYPAEELVTDHHRAPVAAALVTVRNRNHARAVQILAQVGAADRAEPHVEEQISRPGPSGLADLLHPDVALPVKDGRLHEMRRPARDSRETLTSGGGESCSPRGGKPHLLSRVYGATSVWGNRYWATQPPSATSCVPWTYSVKPESMNTIEVASSSGPPIRPSSVRSTIQSSYPSFASR